MLISLPGKLNFQGTGCFYGVVGESALFLSATATTTKRIRGVAEGQEEASMEMQDKENSILPRKTSCMQKE